MSELDVVSKTVKLTPVDAFYPKAARLPSAHTLSWMSAVEAQEELEPSVIVFMTQPAILACAFHAASDLANETGGWLLGKWRMDNRQNQQYVVVDTVLFAEFTRSSSTHLTFTQDSQVAMRRILDEQHPEKELVGWFHTHPRMGVFLSQYDLWLHQHFFPEMWQIALVIEPVSKTCGFFIRTTDGELASRHYFGFTELLGKEGRSVVDWNNLQPSLDLPEGGETCQE